MWEVWRAASFPKALRKVSRELFGVKFGIEHKEVSINDAKDC